MPSRNLRTCGRICAPWSADGLRSGRMFGGRVEGFGYPQSGEKITRPIGRSHFCEADIIPDICRNNSSMGSLSLFLAKTAVMLRGLGSPRGCDMQDAVLIATDLFSTSRRIGRMPTFATRLPVGESDSHPQETDLFRHAWIETRTMGSKTRVFSSTIERISWSVRLRDVHDLNGFLRCAM